MLIRQEKVEDYNEVYQLIADSFAQAEHADGNEQDLVLALRKGNSFIPELSLVAQIENELAGYILFTKAKVGNNDVLILAPLCVKPKYQNQGIGTALILEGHKVAKKLGYNYLLVLGSETYYPKFGYLPATQFNIEIPNGFPTENFMAVKLNENAKLISGAVTLAKEFAM